MTEDMDRVHQAISGQLMQLVNVASHAAELAVQMAARRSMQAERRSAAEGAAAADRLRADRELAAAVWARSRSKRWLAAARPDELVTVWASARAWSPYDRRAARAVEAVGRRLADLGVDVDHTTSALDRQDLPDLGRLLASTEPAGSTEAGAGGSAADREARVLEVVAAEWASSTVEAVTAGDAFGALAYKLGWLEEQGHDMAAVVRWLPETRIVAPEIRQPAAYAAWLVDQYAADGEPVRVAAEGITEPAAEAVARTTSTPAKGRPAQAKTRSTTPAVSETRELA